MPEQPAPQADSAISAEARIAAKFGVPVDDPTPQNEPPPAEQAEPEPQADEDGAEQPIEDSPPEFVEIEWEGQKYQVPPELKPAIDGGLRQQDYTKKTQEVAELRRTIETQAKLFQEQQQFGERVKPYTEQLQQLDAQLKQFESVKWQELSTDDLIRYKMAFDNTEKQRNALASQIESERTKFQQEQQQTLAELTARGNEFLTRSIPNWGKGVEKEVAAFAASIFGEDAIKGIYDPNVVSVLHDAMQYRNLQASKAEASKAVAKAPPVVKPGPARPMPDDVKDKLNFRKAMKSTRSSADKARLIEQRLANRYG